MRLLEPRDDIGRDLLSYMLLDRNVNPGPSAQWFRAMPEEAVAQWQRGGGRPGRLFQERADSLRKADMWSRGQMEEEAGERHAADGLGKRYDLGLIRSVPIESVTLLEVRGNGRLKKVRCPMHDDLNPSCVLYPTGYWCFVCQEGGSAIDWCALEFGMGFREACEFLSKYA